MRKPTQTNTADLGTKPLQKDRIEFLASLANIRIIKHESVKVSKPTKQKHVESVQVSGLNDERILNLAKALSAFLQKS